MHYADLVLSIVGSEMCIRDRCKTLVLRKDKVTHCILYITYLLKLKATAVYVQNHIWSLLPRGLLSVV